MSDGVLRHRRTECHEAWCVTRLLKHACCCGSLPQVVGVARAAACHALVSDGAGMGVTGGPINIIQGTRLSAS